MLNICGLFSLPEYVINVVVSLVGSEDLFGVITHLDNIICACLWFIHYEYI